MNIRKATTDDLDIVANIEPVFPTIEAPREAFKERLPIMQIIFLLFLMATHNRFYRWICNG